MKTAPAEIGEGREVCRWGSPRQGDDNLHRPSPRRQHMDIIEIIAGSAAERTMAGP